MISKFSKAAAAIALLAVAGCYSYTPVPKSMTGNSFTDRDLTKSNNILTDINILTLKQAQEISVMNNPSYIAAYHAVNAARMKYYQSLGQFAPTVTAGFNAGQSFSDYYNVKNMGSGYAGGQSFTTQSNIQVNQILFDGFARYFNAMAAKHNYEYQVDMEENSRRVLMESVAYAYNNILLAKAQRQIALNNRDFQTVNLTASREKYKVGAVAMSEVLNFQIKINDAISSQISAEYDYDTAVFALAALMGYSDGVLPVNVKFEDVKTDLDEPIASIDVYLDTALNNRTDLAAYREALESAKFGLYGAYSAFSPTVTGYSEFGFNTSSSKSYGYSSGSVSYSGSRNYYNNPTFGYGVQAQWVLFNGGQRYNAVREAQASLAQSDYELATHWLSVVQEVRTAYSNYVQSLKQARVMTMQLSLVSKQRELVQIEYDTGNVALPRLNEAQTDYVTAEQNLATALVNIQNAKAQLIAAANIDSTGYNFEDRDVVNK